MASKSNGKVTNGERKKAPSAKGSDSSAAEDTPAKKLKLLEEQLVATIGFSLDDMMCVDEYDEADEKPKKSTRSPERRSSGANRSSSSKYHQSSSSSHRSSHHSSSHSSKQPEKLKAPLKKTANKTLPVSPKKPTSANQSSSGEKTTTKTAVVKPKPVSVKEKGTPLKLSKLVLDHVKAKPETTVSVKAENSLGNADAIDPEAQSTSSGAELQVTSEPPVECKSEPAVVKDEVVTLDVEINVAPTENVVGLQQNLPDDKTVVDRGELELAPDSDDLDYNDTKSETGPSLSENTAEPAKVEPKKATPPGKADRQEKPKATPRKNSTELQPNRSEADPKIAAYVQSLIKLEFDVKKYTCFYCNPCHAFLTTTAQWEEHLSTPAHRKMVCRWRECLELSAESGHDAASKLQTEIENYSDVVVGAHKMVEVRSANGEAHTWVCAMCVSVCANVDQLLSHLSSFEHIDNFMELTDPGLYRPPGRIDQVDNHRRVPSSDQKRGIVEEARQLMDRQGRGRLRTYAGQRFQEWPEEQPETEELEEQLVMDKMELLFSENHSADEFPLKYDIIPSRRSIANHDFDKMKGESGKSMIGMQYMLEIWTPSRRVTPVYYCILCDYLVTNWTVHCTILKHCVCYLIKHYNSVYECVLFESSAEDEFRRALTMARDKVLMLEGRSMRVEHVIQLQGKNDDVFVPINATIAKRIVNEAKLEVPDPVRVKKVPVIAKKTTVTKTVVPTKGAKEKVVAKPRPKELPRNDEKPKPRLLPAKRPLIATESRASDRDPKRRQEPPRVARKEPSDNRSRRASSPPRDKKRDDKGRTIADDKSRSERRSTTESNEQRRTSVPAKSTTVADRSKPSRQHSPSEHRSRDRHDDRPSKPPVKSGSWQNAEGPVALKSLRSLKPTYSNDHHRDRAPPPTHSSDRDRHHNRHDERPRNESNALPRKRHRPHLSTQNLADLEKLLASIGFTVDHRLTERDLDQLEDQFGPKAIDDLCTKVLGAPTSDGGGRFDERSARMGHVEQDPAVAQQLAMLEMGVGGGSAVNSNQFVPGMLMPAMIPGMMPMSAMDPAAVSAMLGMMPMVDHLRGSWPSNY